MDYGENMPPVRSARSATAQRPELLPGYPKTNEYGNEYRKYDDGSYSYLNPKTCRHATDFHPNKTTYWAPAGGDHHYRDRHEGYSFRQPVGTTAKSDRVHKTFDPPQYCLQKRVSQTMNSDSTMFSWSASSTYAGGSSEHCGAFPSPTIVGSGGNERANLWASHEGGGFKYENRNGSHYEENKEGMKYYEDATGRGWTQEKDGQREYFGYDDCGDTGGNDHGYDDCGETGGNDHAGGNDLGYDGGWDDGDDGGWDDSGYDYEGY